MSRAYIIYVVMFAVLIGGLWLILTMGAATQAPDDLTGEWTVTWDGAPPPMAVDPSMKIAQSGRFFVVQIGRRASINLTLQPNWKGAKDGHMLQMGLAGDVWKMKVVGNIPLGDSWRIPQMTVELDGPSRHVGVARRNGMTPATHPAGVARAR